MTRREIKGLFLSPNQVLVSSAIKVGAKTTTTNLYLVVPERRLPSRKAGGWKTPDRFHFGTCFRTMPSTNTARSYSINIAVSHVPNTLGEIDAVRRFYPSESCLVKIRFC